MDTGEIKKLIEAFYNGETTRDEEQKLYDYFSGDNVADELQDEKILFLNMHKSDPIETPPMLERKLEELIDRLAKEDEIKKQPERKKLWLQIGSIAAGLALLISAGIYFNKTQKEINPDNPSLAMTTITTEDKEKIQKAGEALLLLSSNFNKGVSKLEAVSANLDKTNDILSKTFNR